MDTKIDIAALGELLIDFTECGRSASGMRLFEQNPGGAVANVACAGARLGLQTAFLGKVGRDLHGQFLRETLQKEGVETGNLILDKTHFTTMAFVALSENGERTFSFSRNGTADLALTAEEVDPKRIERARILHIGTLSLTDEPARSATMTAVETARRALVPVFCDVNFRPGLWSSEDAMVNASRALLPMVDLLKVSDDEAVLLTGESDPERSSAALMETYPLSLIAVTCGKQGALVRSLSGPARVDALSARAVDTTGAGDAFWASFLYAFLVSGKTLRTILPKDAETFARFAVAAASLCVESRGAIPSMPRLDAVLVRMQQNPA
jgi:fructokinase